MQRRVHWRRAGWRFPFLSRRFIVLYVLRPAAPSWKPCRIRGCTARRPLPCCGRARRIWSEGGGERKLLFSTAERSRAADREKRANTRADRASGGFAVIGVDHGGRVVRARTEAATPVQWTAGEYACGLPRSPVWLRRGGVQYCHVRDPTCERGPSVHGAPRADTEGWTGRAEDGVRRDFWLYFGLRL
jgi:hypothetical protein